MKVKDIIITAFNCAGRQDIAEALSSGAEMTDEQNSAVKTMTCCFNAVEYELARYYFPLEHEDVLTSATGRYNYTSFTRVPTRIIKVTADGKEIEIKRELTYFETKAPLVSVLYEYAPSAKKINDDCSFDGVTVDEGIISAGAASEYCLLNGEVSLAEIWEQRYRSRIDRASQKTYLNLRIPPRRWV